MLRCSQNFNRYNAFESKEVTTYKSVPICGRSFSRREAVAICQMMGYATFNFFQPYWNDVQYYDFYLLQLDSNGSFLLERCNNCQDICFPVQLYCIQTCALKCLRCGNDPYVCMECAGQNRS